MTLEDMMPCNTSFMCSDESRNTTFMCSDEPSTTSFMCSNTINLLQGMVNEFKFEREDIPLPVSTPLTRENVVKHIDYLIDGPPVYVEGDNQVFILRMEDSTDSSYDVSEWSEVWLEYYITDCYLPNSSPSPLSSTRCYKIFSLVIPTRLHRQGIASYIFDRIESKAKSEGRRVLVEPVIEEPMFNFLVKRGNYQQRNIFSFYDV